MAAFAPGVADASDASGASGVPVARLAIAGA